MLPFLNAESENSKKYIVAFRGLNYGEGWTDGELSDCRNVSSSLYPSLTQRWARSVEGAYTAPSAMCVQDGLVIVAGGSVYYNGSKVGTVTEGRKQMATIGNYVVIFPDKVSYNVETGEFSSMEAATEVTGAVFTDSTITGSGFGVFKAGDGITISGSAHGENNKTVIIRNVTDTVLTFYENTFTAGTESGKVTLKREIPDLEFICESNYRLWGTKGNTIYGSKYGDPFNFQVFDGLSGDSYYIDVASEGRFTGCIPYSSHVCFFKEHTMHKMYGTKPSNFQIVSSQVYGVQEGSERSMCVINETLYYKGVNGVYAYTGSVPELISDKFGTERFSEACAESDGERYYISMKRSGKWGVYVFDVKRNMWLMEDDTHCVDMAFHDGHMYLLAENGTLYKIDPDLDQSGIEWSVTFCPFHETVNERKGYSKFHMRLEMAAGAWLAVEIKRDTDTKWAEVYKTHNDRARTVSVPILPARCDSVEIRLSGKGECLLRTFIREFFVGSDV
jgi:hypothetical protein